ncbi:hypothetical protein N0V88_003728 [Collariella sp. IMI 366227]|nr:hypothetical protein N0V88_003728 [Collariella sp. IMI 366227]
MSEEPNSVGQPTEAGQLAEVTHSSPYIPPSEQGHAAPPSSDGLGNDINGDDSAMGNANKPAASKKKKGTASAVKTPAKRARPSTGAGGAKKARGGGTKKTKPDAASKQPGDSADPAAPNGNGNGDGDGDGDSDGGNSSESDHGPYCLCRGPDDHRFMIACDRCEDWFHGECIGMDKHTGENLVQKYICPNCTDNGRYATRYKKMCSLAGCKNPARIYDAARPSIFCSSDHCQAWWEQLVSKLPKTKGADADNLTQEDTALTPEEHALLSTSATARYQLGEEIVLCKKMLQLIDMAHARREAAIAAGRGTAKDLCGYDSRLDDVGATHQFARFVQSPQGEAVFRSGSLDGMCIKKKCKPHNGWSAILFKAVKHDMKELAAQAKEMLDAEQRVRDGAAGRFRRRMKERNGVDLVYEEDGMDVDGD